MVKILLLLNKPSNVELSESNINNTLSAIIAYKNLIVSSDRMNRLTIINNNRKIYDSTVNIDLEFTFRTSIEDSNIEFDLSKILLLRNSNKNTEIDLLFIVSLGRIEFTEYLLNLKHIFDVSEIRIETFSLNSHEFNTGLTLLGNIYKPTLKNFILRTVKKESGRNIFYFPVKCNCHRKEIEIGFLCPVCLTAFCKRIGLCSICKTRISIKNLNN